MQIKSESIELVSVDALIPHPKNMHNHPPEQIERLCKLIEYQGFRTPLTVQRGTNLIVTGHGRLMAAKKLGMEKVPVTYQEFDDDAQIYAHIVADNAIGKDTWATLDLSQINLDIQDLGPELDIDMLGLKDFTIEPLDRLEPQCDEDEVPEVEHPITRRGDVWLLGNHRVMCGDSTMIDDVEKLMNGEKADMVFTDPPYRMTSGGDSGIGKGMFKATIDYKNTGRLFETPDFVEWFKNLRVAIKCDSDIYIMSNDRNLKDVLNCAENEGFKHHGILVMKKDTNTPNRWYLKNGEFVFYGFIGSAKPIKNKGSFCVQDVEMPKNKVHQSQKPVVFIENIILNSSENSVFEPFLGSGSTLIACEKTNRKCYGMELDEHYCDVIIKRWEQYTGKKATLESTGQTYEELKNQREPEGIK